MSDGQDSGYHQSLCLWAADLLELLSSYSTPCWSRLRPAVVVLIFTRTGSIWGPPQCKVVSSCPASGEDRWQLGTLCFQRFSVVQPVVLGCHLLHLWGLSIYSTENISNFVWNTWMSYKCQGVIWPLRKYQLNYQPGHGPPVNTIQVVPVSH